SVKELRLLMFIINRCFDAYASNNIWLESQMIHVALFSFQRTTWSFEALSLQATFISYRIELSLSRSFFFFFEAFWISQVLPLKAFCLCLPYLSATCIMIQYTKGIVNSFFKKT
ncbi:hypothetical protein, partial [Mitsuokella sp.]|uniref:hypothetical protein n=1 Tax=Mitsuokella sp. TaxID=2049034 RepID=UPI003D7E97C9